MTLRLSALLLMAAPMLASADVVPHFGRTGPVVVAYLSGSDSGGSVRLRDLGATVKCVDPETFAASLKDADILYLPSGWAVDETDRGARAALARKKPEIEKFLQAGRAIFVAQPNIDGPIDILPLKFEVLNQYLISDEISVELAHPLTDGLEKSELPYPSDRVVSHDPAFTVLTRGTDSKSASLMVAAWKGGRIVVNVDNDSIRDRIKASVTTAHTSDRAFQRQIEWLARRPLKPAKAQPK